MNTINFPEKEEIRLQNAPLEEVVCQVRFPPILRISEELPSAFQEEIRARFPRLETKQRIMMQIPGIDNTNQPAFETSPKAHDFLTADGKTITTLAADFFALTTKAYTQWEDYLHYLENVTKAVCDIYKPAYATRIGLRFINRFDQENTGTEAYQEILELFREELTCLLQVDAWKEPREMLTQLALDDDPAKMVLRFGYAVKETQPSILVDIDYFEEGQVNINDVIGKTIAYHDRIYQAFRWCLKDTSLDRFDPLTGGS